jgi:rhamnosyltransferase subunit B
MKILLVGMGSTGDVHPLVGLGLALRRRGHEVTLIAAGFFEGLARQVGLGFAPFATKEAYLAMIADPRLNSRVSGFAALMQSATVPAMAPVYEAVCRLHEPGRTVVVASTLGLGARLAQEKRGVPLLTVHLSPMALRSNHRSPVTPGLLVSDGVPRPLKRVQWWLADTLIVESLIGRQLNAFRRELGLPRVKRAFNAWIHSPDGVLGLFPDWFGPPQPDWPSATVLAGFPLYDESGVSDPPAEVKRFVEEGEPPLVFTPGSAAVSARPFFAAAAQACHLMGRRGLLLTRFSDQVPGELPPEVRHAEYVPLGWLLPKAAALVSHGGVGTMAQGLAAGIPQLVMPRAHDQPDNAERLLRVGAGAVLRPSRFRGPLLARALEELLRSEQIRSACRALADRMARTRPLEAACEVVEGMARG